MRNTHFEKLYHLKYHILSLYLTAFEVNNLTYQKPFEQQQSH